MLDAIFIKRMQRLLNGYAEAPQSGHPGQLLGHRKLRRFRLAYWNLGGLGGQGTADRRGAMPELGR